MKYSEGKNSQTVGMSFATNAPLDDRTVVKTKDSLIGQDTWIKPGYLFDGLITAVQETQELYMYIGGKLSTWPSDFLPKTEASTSSASDEIISKYWKKVSSSGLENISGVFTFKGIAESVSPDLSYIVVCTPSIDGREASPIGTFSDLTGDIYYGWENENGGVFYTDSLVLNDLTQQYDRGSDTYEMRSIEYNGNVYYLTTASPIGDDDPQAYENVSGEMIYLENGYRGFTNGAQIQVGDQEGNVLGTAVGYVYNAYTFIELPDPIPVTHTHTVITASSDNSGHVYQIGENEYASNGQIWVKLGSPVEDWIIL